jgi:hypothetical protein
MSFFKISKDAVNVSILSLCGLLYVKLCVNVHHGFASRFFHRSDRIKKSDFFF